MINNNITLISSKFLQLPSALTKIYVNATSPVKTKVRLYYVGLQHT